MINYQPLEDRVLVLPIKEKTNSEVVGGNIVTFGDVSKSGIAIPVTVKKETTEGLVIAVGPGYTARDTGKFIPTILAKGDVVLYGLNNGLPIDLPSEGGGIDECKLMREGDILALISKKEE